MANINITVDEDYLITIDLDIYEWTSLRVNDGVVPLNKVGNPPLQFHYKQGAQNSLVFVAHAQKALQASQSHPLLALKLGSEEGDKRTMFLSWSSIDNNDETVCLGALTMIEGWSADAQEGPLRFNEVHMTGIFDTSK